MKKPTWTGTLGGGTKPPNGKNPKMEAVQILEYLQGDIQHRKKAVAKGEWFHPIIFRLMSPFTPNEFNMAKKRRHHIWEGEEDGRMSMPSTRRTN
jgi:hypothetical protein